MDANTLPTNWATVADDGTVALAGSAGGGASRPTGTTPRARRSGSPSRGRDDDRALAARVAAVPPGDDELPAELDAGAGALTSDGTRSRTPRGRPPSGERGATTRRGPICSAWPTPRNHHPHVLRCGLDGAWRRRCSPTTCSTAAPRSRATRPRRTRPVRRAPGRRRRRLGAAGGFQNPVTPAAANTAPPVHISIPAIGSGLGPHRTDRGADGWIRVPPADYDAAVGWYEKGVLPERSVPAVIAGHVDSPTCRRCSTTCRG